MQFPDAEALARAARQALEGLELPGIGRSLAEIGAIRELSAQGGQLAVALELPVPVGDMREEAAALLAARLADRGISAPLSLSLAASIRAHAVQKPLRPMPGIHNIVAVASGKGGVGKSTVAVNLALAWAAAGARVGILDADIYGPSQPLMLGVSGTRPATRENKRIVPVEAHGLKLMSIGLLIDADQPAVWRGPMVTQALTQLLTETDWGELDYLVIDMPPGTGDLQLTLAQRVPVAGAIIVTTPQEIAVADARKGLKMFEKTGISVLGIVENMATHICSACGHEDPIFGSGGGELLAREAGIALLGRLPLDAQIRSETDSGRPTMVSAAGTARARALAGMARNVAGALSRRPPDHSGKFGTVVVEGRR
jgi:ATP-binding protein involved in chromosome partitioning